MKCMSSKCLYFGSRVVNLGIPDDFGIFKSRDLNFGILGIILIPGFAYWDPGPPGIDFNNQVIRHSLFTSRKF
jgi:hypothetical protein